MSASMDWIFQSIKNERRRQDKKWGESNHLMVEWMPILMEEVGEVAKHILDAHFDKRVEEQDKKVCMAEKELVHVAAVCVAMIECLGRNGFIGKEAIDWPPPKDRE